MSEVACARPATTVDPPEWATCVTTFSNSRSLSPPYTPIRNRRRRSGKQCFNLPSPQVGNWMCSIALARSMSAAAADRSGELACHAESPDRVLASVPCLPEPAGPGETSLPTRRNCFATPSEVNPRHTCEEPNGSPSARRFAYQYHAHRGKHCRAVTKVAGECHDHRNRAQRINTDVFQARSCVQVVGTSSSVGAERTTDVTQVVRGTFCRPSQGRAIPSLPSQPVPAAGLPTHLGLLTRPPTAPPT